MERPGKEDDDFDEKEIRDDFYMNLPKVEKEKFAHQYADRLKRELTDCGVIPFSTIK